MNVLSSNFWMNETPNKDNNTTLVMIVNQLSFALDLMKTVKIGENCVGFRIGICSPPKNTFLVNYKAPFFLIQTM